MARFSLQDRSIPLHFGPEMKWGRLDGPDAEQRQHRHPQGGNRCSDVCSARPRSSWACPCDDGPDLSRPTHHPDRAFCGRWTFRRARPPHRPVHVDDARPDHPHRECRWRRRHDRRGAHGARGPGRLHAADPSPGAGGGRDAYRNLPYDTVKDFEPLGLINQGPYVIVSKTGLETRTSPSSSST